MSWNIMLLVFFYLKIKNFILAHGPYKNWKHAGFGQRTTCAELSLVAQSCLTLCEPMDCSPPGSMGILQTRILEWVAMPSSRGSSQPKDRTQVSRITGEFFTVWATREAQPYAYPCFHQCRNKNCHSSAVCIWLWSDFSWRQMPPQGTKAEKQSNVWPEAKARKD